MVNSINTKLKMIKKKKLLFNILYCSKKNNKSIFIRYFCKVKIVFIEVKKKKLCIVIVIKC